VGSAIFLSSALVTTVDVYFNNIQLWLLWGIGIGLFFCYIVLVHVISKCVVDDVKNNKNSKYMKMIRNSKHYHHHHQHFPEEGIEILNHVYSKNKQNSNTVLIAKIDSTDK
jgi:ABC-type nickel/cobalt efflux system permease component RcnA